jgi:hypothetical protein
MDGQMDEWIDMKKAYKDIHNIIEERG